MKIIAPLTIILAFVLTIGCSTRNAYEGLRFRQDSECQKLYGTEQEECSRRSAPSYDEYQRQTKERQDNKR